MKYQVLSAKKYPRMSSAAVMISTLRVNLQKSHFISYALDSYKDIA